MRILLFAVLCAAMPAAAFTVHEKEGAEAGRTLVVVGGIQGDEPGGFMAANLLVTHYTITKGQVRVVPNLNFESIIARHRGVHGDMNRKFAQLPDDDPEYATVDRVKRLIADERVNGVINLHDGGGFYRESYVDRLRNPNRWGQCTIIDQAALDVPFGDLGQIARGVTDHVNRHLLDPEHRFAVKDTRTRWGNAEMAKTLTFFAIEQGKPAFAVEASKSLGTAHRTYYHLLAVEGYFKAFGIEFERGFPLTPHGVEAAIASHPQIALYDNRVVLDVADARSVLGYVPMKRSGVDFASSSPLVALVPQGAGYNVWYGNRRLTRLQPQFLDYDDGLDEVTLAVDGETRSVPFGSIVPVKEVFAALAPAGYRVNIIGFTRDDLADEAGIGVRRNDFLERFSVDRKGQIFRVEVYRGERFAGMVLVDFAARSATAPRWFAGKTLAATRPAVPPPADKALGR
jgi:hypothetical protein